MKNIRIYYGSSTGTTEVIAKRIARKLGVSDDLVKNVSDIDLKDVNSADILLLGSSTWGEGEVQDDWYKGLELLKSADLKGKKIALFGCGDSQGFSDTFCGALGILYRELKDSGAQFIGFVPTDDYDYNDSEAVTNGMFVGLALDEISEDQKTEGRIVKWIERIKGFLM